MEEQFKVQKLISAFDKPKWCIVRYGLGSSFGCCGDSKVVDIYDVPHQKAPEGTFEKCRELVKVMYANRILSEDEIVGHTYGMVEQIESQLTDDYAYRYCGELNAKHKDSFISKDYWDASREVEEVAKKAKEESK